jgi:hypothetical protein
MEEINNEIGLVAIVQRGLNAPSPGAESEKAEKEPSAEYV